MPCIGEIAPSTFKYDPRPYQFIIWPKDYLKKPDPLLEIHHSIKVTVELQGAEKFTIESSVIVSSVSRNNCLKVLEQIPEIVPALDYERVMGTDVWVPEYAEKDD